MKKFILIDHEPWTKRRKELFYDLFQQAGINLEVWDLSQWLYPGLSHPDEITDTPYLHKITDESNFLSFLKRESPENTILIEEIFRNWDNRHVFKAIKDNGFHSIKIELYGNTILKQSVWKNLYNISLNEIGKIFRNKISSIKFKIFRRINKISSRPSIIISSNSILPRTHAFNHPDYEKFMFDTNIPIFQKDYIVFCDTFFPYHPELKFFYKYNQAPDGEKYQAQMRAYFDFLEEKYNLPVVIAAHPKSNYKGDEFGKRKIIKYQTNNLIKYSSMVTMHICNTISYTILGDKPIAFVATNDYLSIPGSRRKLSLLSEDTLGLSYYNLDDIDFKEKFKFAKVATDLREKYIYSYLTSVETRNIPNPQTLYNVLSKL